MNLKTTSAALALTALLAACSAVRSSPDSYEGAVYAQTNETVNTIVAFGRKTDGTLVKLNTYATGGAGTAGKLVPLLEKVVVDPFFSNDSLIISPDHKLLFAVNTGDGTVTSFKVNADKTLTRVDRAPSGGKLPQSLGYNGDGLLYVSNVNNPKNVLNPNGDKRASISGLRVDALGKLTPIPNSTRELSTDATQPGHVTFSPNGKQLLVIELFAKTISVYPTNADGTLGTPMLNSVPVDAFGSDFIGNNTLITVDVTPFNPGNGTASSFTLNDDGSLTPLTVGVRNGKIEPCWVSITPDGKFAFTSNLDTGTISSYRLDQGKLSLLNADAAFKPAEGAKSAIDYVTSGPVDTFITPDGKYLYQQYSGRGSVVAYQIGADGSLKEVGEYGRGDIMKIGSEGLDGF
jgi:6-phosphogluconolactonase (cycloisomerase 2 family)